MEPTAAEVFFQDWDSLVTAKDRLLTEGWACEVNDSPETGVRGFACTASGTGERTVLQWAMFGKVLTPKVRVLATWQEFLTEIEFRRNEDMEKCDSLSEGQVGFASYGRAVGGIAEVTRIRIEDLQAGGVEARGRLINILTSSKHPGAALLKQVQSRR